MALYYYSRDNANFGDEIGPVIVEAILQRKIKRTNGFQAEEVRNSTGGNIVGLGSILHLAGQGDIVWGTGANPLRPFAPDAAATIHSLDIRAVRGPLTREFVRTQFNKDCPEVFGDPALLVSKFSPRARDTSKRSVGIIPHYQDLQHIKGENVISPLADWQKILTFIVTSEKIVSSSLHGIIVAEAYGVPAFWLFNQKLPSSRTEGTFKYNDYYASTGRPENCYINTIDDANTTKSMTEYMDYDTQALLDAFPKQESETLL